MLCHNCGSYQCVCEHPDVDEMIAEALEENLTIEDIDELIAIEIHEINCLTATINSLQEKTTSRIKRQKELTKGKMDLCAEIGHKWEDIEYTTGYMMSFYLGKEVRKCAVCGVTQVRPKPDAWEDTPIS